MPSADQQAMAREDAADAGIEHVAAELLPRPVPPPELIEYELKLPGWNGSVRATLGEKYITLIVDDFGSCAALLLEPDEVRALARGLQVLVGDA